MCEEGSVIGIDWRCESDWVVKTHRRLGSVGIHHRRSVRSIDRSRSVCIHGSSVKHRCGNKVVKFWYIVNRLDLVGVKRVCRSGEMSVVQKVSKE